MKPATRNFLATVCLQHVKVTDPAAFRALRELAEENYRTGHQQFSAGYVYRKFVEMAKNALVTEVI